VHISTREEITWRQLDAEDMVAGPVDLGGAQLGERYLRGGPYALMYGCLCACSACAPGATVCVPG
jgi:hypothetical protein